MLRAYQSNYSDFIEGSPLVRLIFSDNKADQAITLG